MRISPHDQAKIKETATKVFGAEVSVWLFGSRLDDTAKGGDIDLLIKLEHSAADKAVLAARYGALLQLELGMQKIDVLVIDPTSKIQPIHQQALSTGVRL